MSTTVGKPLTQRLHESMGGSSLFGSVSMPNSPLPEALPSRTSIPIREAPVSERPTILPRLLALQPESPQLRERLSAMIAELAPLLTEAQELEQTIQQERQASLEAQHKEIRKQGRKQQAIAGQLSQEHANAELNLRNCMARQDNAFRELQNLKLLEERNEHVPRWASDAELEKWGERINKAKAKVTAANEEVAVAVQERNQAGERLRPAAEEMARLGQEEIRIRSEIAGTEYTDPEFGLSSAPVGAR